MTLDVNNTNVAYRLGRLFATFEKIQEEANDRKLNSTIRDKYYTSASATPNSIFSLLIPGHFHHIDKLKNKGRAVNFEKYIGEIMSHITSFPSRLNLNDQGQFAIGYYHQRQAWFEGIDFTTNEKGE